ncbi:MAG TPA: DUF4340 domain-containing protein [Methylomirabilota bacterium]|nr:DUF4340 domain-containing protein [Methylomirabilota bacterium]
MRWQTTAVLAAFLATLAVFYYVWDVRLAPEREKAAERKGRVLTVEPGDVKEVVLRRGSETIRLRREGDGWEMAEPVAGRGDRASVDEVVTSVAMAKMDREISGKPDSLAEFGLDKPAAEATLVGKDGKEITLLLGAKSPTGVWVYAQERGRPNVVVVSDGVLRDVTRPVGDFRNKTILAFDRQDVTGLEVALPEETLAVERAGDAQWKVTRPRPLRADTQAVSDFLEKLAGSRIKEFVAEAPPSLEPYGLARPVRVAIHVGKDKDRATRALLLGRRDDKKKGVYALRPGEASVLLLPEEVWTTLPKATAAIRDKTVVDFERDQVTGLEIEGPRGSVALSREGERWTITRPQPLPADQVEAGAVLMSLKNMRARAFLAEDASAVPRYLERPTVRANVALKEGAPLTVLLAPAPEKREGRPMAYAAVAGRGPVVLVEASLLTEVGRSLTELRDRTLVAGLDPKDVKRLRIRRGNSAVLLERTGDTEWRFLEGGKGEARGNKVDDILYALRGLKWKEIAAPPGEDLGRFGLEAPAAEIRLYRADGTTMETVLFGKSEGNRLYLKTAATPAVYVVDDKLLQLPKIPDDLQG